ncbi:MAG: histidinol-phosphate transaminase [Betaproteobacteria bacterium]
MNDRARAPGFAAARGTAAVDYVAAVVRPDVRAQSAYVVADARGMVKLDANENAHPLPAPAKARLMAALADVAINRYPDGPSTSATASVRRLLRLDDGTALLLGNGSDELISLVISLVAKPGACVLAPEPTFVMYRVSSQHSGVRFAGVALDPDFTLDMPGMLKAIERERPAVMFVASPNNPTGARYASGDVEMLIRATPGLVVVDEAYSPFADEAFLPRVGEFPNVLVMGTLSKIGMAGLRLGYVVGAPEWIAELNKLRPPYNVSALTQAAVVALLAEAGWIAQQGAAIRAERGRLADALAQLPGVTVFASQANFILIRVGAARRMFEALKLRGVLVKDVSGSHPLLADCLRITVGTTEENDILMAQMRELGLRCGP